MKLAAVLFSALGLWLATPAVANKTNVEEQAIREQAAKFVTEWNRHDTKAMAAFWNEDGTVINPMGRRANGRAEIEKLFVEEHAGVMRTTQTSMTMDTVRFVRPDVAISDWSMELTGMKTPDGKDLAPQKMHLVVVAVKKAKRWSWSDVRPYAFQTPPSEVASNRN